MDTHLSQHTRFDLGNAAPPPTRSAACAIKPIVRRPMKSEYTLKRRALRQTYRPEGGPHEGQLTRPWYRLQGRPIKADRDRDIQKDEIAKTPQPDQAPQGASLRAGRLPESTYKHKARHTSGSFQR